MTRRAPLGAATDSTYVEVEMISLSMVVGGRGFETATGDIVFCIRRDGRESLNWQLMSGGGRILQPRVA